MRKIFYGTTSNLVTANYGSNCSVSAANTATLYTIATNVDFAGVVISHYDGITAVSLFYYLRCE